MRDKKKGLGFRVWGGLAEYPNNQTVVVTWTLPKRSSTFLENTVESTLNTPSIKVQVREQESPPFHASPD